MSGPIDLTPRDPREVGPYRLLSRIGGGGQGTVYLGTTGAGDPVAVKVLNTDFEDTGRLKTALNRELASAQSVAAFVTAQVITFDLDADPPYIATEYVDGPTLEHEVREGAGPLRGSRLADLAIQTVLALEAIHAAGVIHCDFKPGNIMLGRGGVKVIDFGIARAYESMHQVASRVIGSAHFMAPEQVDNRPLGPAVDVFAWGAVMVFAATGRYAFPGRNPVAVGLRVVQDEPDLHGMTGPLAALVRECLHKDPAGRPTAADLRAALMAPAGTVPPRRPAPVTAALPVAPAAPPTVPVTRPRRRSRLGPLLVAVVVLALAGAGVGWAWGRWEKGGGPGAPDPSATTADPHLVALQQFGSLPSLDGCAPLAPTARQQARMTCSGDGLQTTYALFRQEPVDERAEERKRVLRIHEGAAADLGLRRGTGTSADGRRGEYIEYTYRAGDDDKWYAALWWDDGIDRPGSAAVLTMRTPWDGRQPDPAGALREAWLARGFRLG